MTKPKRERRRLLAVLKMLEERTDEAHGLTMAQIRERLFEDYGITTERRTIYKDIDAIDSLGWPVIKRQKTRMEYSLAPRTFAFEELSLLIDAVGACRSLTDDKAQDLINKIKGLASADERARLNKMMEVEGRVRTMNESALTNVAIIQNAINARKKIAYTYCSFDKTMTLVPRKMGETYIETPVKLVYSDSNYYVLAYNEKHAGIATYRVDRMHNLCVSKESAARNETTSTLDVSKYTNRAFSMYSGRQVSVKLLAHVDCMNAIADRFGESAKVSASDQADYSHVTVSVMDAPTFYGWVAQFGDKMKIEGPASVVSSFRAHISEITALYD